MEEVRRYVRRKRILFTIIGIWLALCVMWFVIDLLDDSRSWWFYWPMLGTGIGVAIAAIALLGLGGLMGTEWEPRDRQVHEPPKGRTGRVAPLGSLREVALGCLIRRVGHAPAPARYWAAMAERLPEEA
jgi:hypothetical protein